MGETKVSLSSSSPAAAGATTAGRRMSGHAGVLAASAKAHGAASAKEKEVPSFQHLSIPAGAMTVQHLSAIGKLVELGARDVTLSSLISKLTQHQRSLSGNVLMAFLNPIFESKAKAASPTVEHKEWVNLMKTFCQDIHEIRTASSYLSVRFRFKDKKTIRMPASNHWVLEARIKDNPFLVHANNTPKPVQLEARTFVLKEEVRLNLANGRIESIREGDLCYKAAVFNLNAKIRTEHAGGRVELDDDNRPYLEMNDKGKPVIRDNHYIPRRYDNWLVITVAFKETWVGLPDFG